MIVTMRKGLIFAGAAAMAIAFGVPAEGGRNSDNRGAVQGLNSSGWQFSGYGITSDMIRASKKSSGRASASDRAAKGGRSVSEPSNLMMLGLGLIGLIVGRMVAKRRKKT